MKSTLKLGAMALAAMLVLSVVAPAVLAASAAGNTAGNASVTTGEAENVTNSSAEIHGEVEGLHDDESATVSFTYWVEGDSANATNTASATTDEDAEFKETVTGLQNNTTYVYVAKAEVTNSTSGETYTVSGEESTFTTGAEEDEGDGNASDAFGQDVSAFVHGLLENESVDNQSIGQMVSEYVTENNPGADKRPDHAGPPEDRGKSADKRQGPPEDKGQDGDRGPPADRGPGGDDADTDDADTDADTDEDDEDDEEETEDS